ncbi:MAG: Nif3-like dinuclear metal center hexameric protein [Terrimicrobiaceae bacterium]
MKLEEVVRYQNDLLRIWEFDDYPDALNGLQLENSGTVDRVAAAVDACEAVLGMAVEAGANLLIVHHGLFWGGLQAATGARYRKLKLAIENDLAIYSAHLPLDAHPQLGNNALLCNALDLPGPRQPFLKIGLQVEAFVDRQTLLDRLENSVSGKVHLAPGGPPVTRKIGVVTGAAGGEIFNAAAEGIDTFITGEGPHWSFTAAEELHVNILYAGHYATEVFGVQALAKSLETRFGLPWTFLHHPTGL